MVAPQFEPVVPTPQDVALAKSASRSLSAVVHPGRPVRLQEADGGGQATVEIPAAAVPLIQRILSEMAAGNAVTIIPVHAELTTQQAADFLGASRPFVVKLLESGRLPFRKVGTHRRIRFDDLMAFKRETVAKRRRTLDELAADAQDLDPGY